MSNRQKQANYRKRMSERGLVQVAEWIPEADKAYFRQIARELREGRRQQAPASTSAAPGQQAPASTSAAPGQQAPASTSRPSQAVSTPSPTAAKSPHSRPDYPPEVRRMAVELSDSGIAPAQIRQRIVEIVGRAPDSKNWGKVIRIWRERLNS